MEEYTNIRVEKNTQKFIQYISDLPKDKVDKVINLLKTLSDQQSIEANLEGKRGWRYMWQRTPKPYLLALGYFIFFGSVGSFGYQAISKAPESITINSLILAGILIIPLILVFYLGYKYVNNKELQEEDIKENKDNLTQE